MNCQTGSNYRTPSNFISRNAQSIIFNAKMRRLWVLNTSFAWISSIDWSFLMWEWTVSDNLNLSDSSIHTLVKLSSSNLSMDLFSLQSVTKCSLDVEGLGYSSVFSLLKDLPEEFCLYSVDESQYMLCLAGLFTENARKQGKAFLLSIPCTSPWQKHGMLFRGYKGFFVILSLMDLI